MSYLPTLYKARKVPVKQPVCAICVDRTRGRTSEVVLGYGVKVWLCAGHASAEFMAQRSGRDFVTTLMRTWQANGCFTRARSKALDAHLTSLLPRPARPQPGSYAWPELRRRVERACARGATLAALMGNVERQTFTNARPPSRRTVARWRGERRWVVVQGPSP